MAKIKKDRGTDSDFTLSEDGGYPVWITVGEFSVMLKNSGDEMTVKVYALCKEDEDELGELSVSIDMEEDE